MTKTTRPLSRHALLAIIDHTLLKPETTLTECIEFIQDAQHMGLRRVCISPSLLQALTASTIKQTDLELVTVVGFPSGAHTVDVKAAEATMAIEAGAAEIDMVANLAHIMAGEYVALEAELQAVRAVTSGTILKVILETACLTDEQIRSSCRVARDAGLDFVKTSTGFHPAGGATAHAVAIMSESVGAQLGVKASGGIRTAAEASAMIVAGATRLGLSATRQILEQWDHEDAPPAQSAPHADRY